MLKHFRSSSKRVRTIWWVLTIGTVVTFIGGFIIFGPRMGNDSLNSQQGPSVVAKMDGEEISGSELSDATARSLASYQAQRGSAPEGRDAAMLRDQAWSSLVTEKVISVFARRLGIKTSDAEVVYVAKNSPPTDITMNPAFQTNSRFDMAKWQQALADPSINWSPLEERVRALLPAQRLEERMVAGVKISEPELRHAFAVRNDSVRATVAIMPSGPAPDSSQLDETALRKYYESHSAEFNGPDEAQLEVVHLQRTVGPEEERAVKIAIEGLRDRARGGADFASLVHEQGEGPYVDKGGDLGQDIPVANLPPEFQTALAPLPVGGVTDPIRQGNGFWILRVNERKVVAGQQAIRLSVLQKSIEPSPESAQKDAETMLKMRKDAEHEPLSAVAARHQLVTQSTGWFAQQMYVPALINVPQLQQWALQANKGDVSRVLQLDQEWILTQVTGRRVPGPRSFDDARDRVRAALQSELQRQAPLEDAKKLLAEVRAGKSLEDAAAAVGAIVAHTGWFTRVSPDRAIANFPRAVGVAFGLQPGAVGPPVADLGGVAVVRCDEVKPGNPAQFEATKGNLSQSILSDRQSRYVRGWIERLVEESKVKDLRPPIESNL